VIFLAVIVLGLVLVGVNVWQRRGRTPRARSWAEGTDPQLTDRKVLVLWPAFAAMAVCGGAVGLAAGTALVVPFALGFLVSALVFLVFAVLPVRVPRFVMPGWYAAEGRRA
jgi:hypothetical protein